MQGLRGGPTSISLLSRDSIKCPLHNQLYTHWSVQLSIIMKGDSFPVIVLNVDTQKLIRVYKIKECGKISFKWSIYDLFLFPKAHGSS